MPLLLVQGFANTVDEEEGTDRFDDPETSRKWLVGAGLLRRDAEFASGDLEIARAVRDSIRAMLMANAGYTVRAEELTPLRSVADARHPRLALDDKGAISLQGPGRQDVRDALFELLLIVRVAQERGTWARLKLCGNPECRWAYYDRSRNQQGTWCDMAVCGNRLKNRQLRARQS